MAYDRSKIKKRKSRVVADSKHNAVRQHIEDIKRDREEGATWEAIADAINAGRKGLPALTATQVRVYFRRFVAATVAVRVAARRADTVADTVAPSVAPIATKPALAGALQAVPILDQPISENAMANSVLINKVRKDTQPVDSNDKSADPLGLDYKKMEEARRARARFEIPD